jgi:hypothetical protein
MVTLERLLYTSRETDLMGTLSLFNLLNHARQNNTQRGITGHLVYRDGEFMQCIEGPPDAIEHLWQSLQKDPRHHAVQIISRGPTEKRHFSDWSMAFSSYRYLNSFNMPGFFPLNEEGSNEHVLSCKGA